MQRVQASSLLETIVAMVILLTVFAVSIVVIQNVLSTANIGDKNRSILLLQEELMTTIQHKRYLNEEVVNGQVTIRKEIYDSILSDSLLVIDLKAVDAKQRVLAEVKETVLKDE